MHLVGALAIMNLVDLQILIVLMVLETMVLEDALSSMALLKEQYYQEQEMFVLFLLLLVLVIMLEMVEMEHFAVVDLVFVHLVLIFHLPILELLVILMGHQEHHVLRM
jgi:hypothetical protein